MLQALPWALASGFLARALLSGTKPGPLLTVLAGTGGCFIAFFVGHQLLSLHEFHLFKPESLIPAVIASVVILLAARRLLGLSRRRTIFS